MNYKWKKTLEKGQRATGFVEIYETTTNEKSVRAIINYFPKFDQFGNNKICSVAITYACSENEITDGFCHWINDDIIDLIKSRESDLFESSMDKFSLMMTQQFFVPKLQEIKYLTHGDYSDSNYKRHKN